MRDDEPTPVPNLRPNHFSTLKWVLGILISACGLFGGAFVAIARMPQAGDFRATQDQVTAIRIDMAVIKANQLGADQRAAEAQQRNEAQFRELKDLLNERRRAR